MNAYPLLLLAQAPDTVISSQTVWEFLESGGYLMWPLALCSVLVLTLAMERFLALRRSRILPDGLEEAVGLLRDGDIDGSIARSEALAAPVGRILCAGIRRRHWQPEDIERAMEDQAAKEMDTMRSRIRSLTVIANVAPLLGLLGTVVGIQAAFASVKEAGVGDPKMLAGGIEEALVTTIAGLVVAIPAMLLASHLSSKVRRRMMEADEQLAPALELLVEQGRGQHAA